MHTLPPVFAMNLPSRTVRNLALLAVAVIWVHGVMLGGLPLSLGWLQAVQSPTADSTTSFLTRSIPAPSPVPLAASKVAAVPKATPAPPTEAADIARISDKKVAAERIQPAQAATETIAKDRSQPATEPPTQSPPQTPSGASTAMAAVSLAVPAPVRIKYDIKGEVKGFPYTANGELLWLQDGKTYDARLEISHFLLGSRVQTSKGLISAQGLEPIRFGDKVRSEVAAHFERDKGKVIFSANTPEVVLLPGAQDQLSVLLQLTTLLGNEPARFTSGTQVPFQAIGPRSAENWVFTAGDLEKIALPGGDMTGLKFTRPPVSEFEPRLEVWFGPDVAYLPIRIRLSQSNGDFVEQMWRGTQKP
jgi:hypothetical protein